MNVVALRGVALLLLSGLGFLCVEADIPIQPNFDLQQFAGQWYPIAGTQDKGNIFRSMSSAPFFEATGDGRLTWTVEIPVEGTKCKKKRYYLPQVDQPGKYKAKNENIFRVVETDYTSYYLFHRENPDFNILALYARTKEVSEELKAKLAAGAALLGYPVDKIEALQLKECAEPKDYVN